MKKFKITYKVPTYLVYEVDADTLAEAVKMVDADQWASVHKVAEWMDHDQRERWAAIDLGEGN